MGSYLSTSPASEEHRRRNVAFQQAWKASHMLLGDIQNHRIRFMEGLRNPNVALSRRSDDPVWRACALSWIATRLDDLEYMVEMDRSSLDEAFKKVSGRLQKDPPRTLTEDEVNDEKIVAFIAKYESGGETSSWGDKTLEWLNAIAQWDDMCLWNEFKANEEAWRQEHIAFWGYDR